ncbi:protein shortage in chiasmata 1 ortholog-like [Centruroides vittatus]|uniref:protein shortage in chiasmata 1 ortholog-like n=1 Tax=Centruroides vittatus TaxID=120091 RepID=UPI00350FED24
MTDDLKSRLTSDGDGDGGYKHAYDYIQKCIENLIEESFQYRNGMLIMKKRNRLLHTVDQSFSNNDSSFDKIRLIDPDSEEIYYTLLSLHSLIKCKEYLLHYHISVTLDYIEKCILCESLKKNLNNVFKDLSKIKFDMETSNCLHPKMLALYKYLIRELQLKNRQFQLLIIVKNYSHIICPIIKEVLKKLIQTDIKIFLNENIVLKTRSEGATIIISNMITDKTPLCYFTMIIEYDSCKSFRETYYKNYSLVYIRFNVELSLDEIPLNKIGSEDDQSFIVIGSTKITKDLALLRILEISYNMTLIERDYQKFNNLSSEETLYFVDVIVDEKTGIFIENYKLMTKVYLEQLSIKIKCLSLKYETCWLIIAASEADPKTMCHICKILSLKNTNGFKLEASF